MRKFLTGLFQNGLTWMGPLMTDDDAHRSDERPPSRFSAVVILIFGILMVFSALASCDKVACDA